jgi:hypothetical protein
MTAFIVTAIAVVIALSMRAKFAAGQILEDAKVKALELEKARLEKLLAQSSEDQPS